jgi:hypothetical protein
VSILELLDKNSIPYKTVVCFNDSFFSALPISVMQYLKCMGITIALNKTLFGSAYTTLFSVDEIKEEQHSVCTANNLLVIGCGLNGDLLTVNLSNSKVGYVFHDELWDETYEMFEDIYVEMPFEIEEFIRKAIENKNYPIDATMAEELFKVI